MGFLFNIFYFFSTISSTMKKKQAVKIYGQDIVDRAKQMYETNSGKVLFVEDCDYDDDIPCDNTTQLEYLNRARALKMSA
jgi:hypothetical protein